MRILLTQLWYYNILMSISIFVVENLNYILSLESVMEISYLDLMYYISENTRSQMYMRSNLEIIWPNSGNRGDLSKCVKVFIFDTPLGRINVLVT